MALMGYFMTNNTRWEWQQLPQPDQIEENTLLPAPRRWWDIFWMMTPRYESRNGTLLIKCLGTCGTRTWCTGMSHLFVSIFTIFFYFLLSVQLLLLLTFNFRTVSKDRDVCFCRKRRLELFGDLERREVISKCLQPQLSESNIQTTQQRVSHKHPQR